MAEQPFLEHLEELRSVLIKSLASVLVLYLPAFFITPYAIRGIIAWSCPPGMQSFNYFAPMEVFILQLKLAFVLAFAMAFPYILWQGWKFLLPALYEGERKALKWWVLASTLLFAAGAAFCFVFILPFVMRFSLSFSSDMLKPVIGISSFLTLAGWMVLAFGVMFQFPLAVMLAVRFGFVNKAQLKHLRPYVFVGILIVAAFLTPPDVISQLMLGIPTYILFELGLFLAKDKAA
ncbi:sec-independent protein translocase protein TatC [Elusimicrobium posterum]|uniref:twin-arginine translocase subunit TatC n=1 Tax=Elusimicrobium posterum TaxID=3116653 RepID=UPI003C79503E